jgi:hypothetical protein
LGSTTARAETLHEVVVVIPPDVTVRLLEADTDEVPEPDDEDDDVLDPAVAVTCDPLAELLEASAEHVLLGVAAAVPNEASATITRAAVGVAMSPRRFLLTHEYMGPPSLQTVFVAPPSTYTRKAPQLGGPGLENAAFCARNPRRPSRIHPAVESVADRWTDYWLQMAGRRVHTMVPELIVLAARELVVLILVVGFVVWLAFRLVRDTRR